MTMRFDNWIAGEWVGSDARIENINPSDTHDVIGLYAQANFDDLERSVKAAINAQKQWRATPLEARQAVLDRIGRALMENADSLGELLSREEGKTRPEGRGEVYRAGQFFTYYAAEVLRQMGDTADSVRPGIEIDVRREPVGVVAIISPWNFPMATAAWKIAPALAFGNAVIWKPANLTPASAVALTEIIAQQDIPAGLFNLLMGSGSVLGDGLTAHPGVDAVSFTGSVDVGRKVATQAASHFAKVQLEMGSKNALLVMDDADLDLAVQTAANGAFGSTGQKCTASSRLVVHDTVLDAFVDKLQKHMQGLVVGHALDATTQIGPVSSLTQLNENIRYLGVGRDEGAELLCGGELLELETPGYFMQPALFINTNNSMTINREEMFAPIASVIGVGSYEEGLATVNDTKFGLTSGIMTRSLARANHFRRNAQTGCVMVNLPTAGTDYHVPFGGRGDSSYGSREQGQYAVEFYTTVKTSYIAQGEPE
ncbi:MAG TPA: aldehyde dehydrogenase family protein [Gammaproteobacteria bacterium]|jgi:aldehyde dehydrogenase (NAD+)|nr:aldehyde dehydrogenase family protein [Gammaproteobacteria bacterium]